MARRNPSFPVGIDYRPLDAETQSWDEWYEKDFESDFAQFAEAKISLVRVFISWKALEQQVGQYDDATEARLDELVAAARSSGVRLIVDFFAHDEIAELTSVPWGRKRDPRTDEYMIARECALVQRIVNKYRQEPVVYAWELCDEVFAQGFQSAEAMRSWVSRLTDAIREIDQERPVLVGVDVETLFFATGVDATEPVESCGLAVSHVTAPYRIYAAEGPLTSGPSTYLPGFLLRLADRGIPVLADGIGAFSLDESLAEEAAFVRTSLYSALMNGAAGALLRRFRDVDTERREPYFRDPNEVLVGVADNAGRPKPSWAEVRAFIDVVGSIDLKALRPLRERTAIVMPAEREDPLPSLAGLYDPRSCLAGYVTAKEAHLPVDVIHEEDGFGSFMALFVPSAFALKESTWERLSDFVQSGGALVLTYGGGDAHPVVRDLFGIEFLGDDGPRSVFSCRVAQPGTVGDIQSFDAKWEVPHFGLLGKGRAVVVATDASGNPLLTVNQHGQGKAVFIAAPMERALAQGDPWTAPEPVKRFLRTVYAAVAAGAGGAGPVECDRPEVEVAVLTGDDEAVLLLMNHSDEKTVAGLRFDRKVYSVQDTRGGATVDVGGYTLGVPLGPNGVAALRLGLSEARETDEETR
ncbi:MAG: hypothetical protein Kow0056_10110 [Coriobacteriia bacterium]